MFTMSGICYIDKNQLVEVEGKSYTVARVVVQSTFRHSTGNINQKPEKVGCWWYNNKLVSHSSGRFIPEASNINQKPDETRTEDRSTSKGGFYHCKG